MSWKLVRPEEVAQAFPDAELRGTDIRVTLAEGAYALPNAQRLEGLTFAFDASARGFVEGYDAPADVDAAGVVGTGEGGEGLTPPLVYGGDRAWLKYAVEARVKAEAGAALPYVSLSGSGDVRVLLADYHLHDTKENARQALLKDALQLRLPLLPESIGRLGVGEALSIQTRGRLSTTVSLNAAEAFTSNLRAVSDLFSAGTLVTLNTWMQVSLLARLEFTDDYVIVFSRPEAGRVRVQVKKAVAREAGTTAGLKVSAQLPEAERVASWLGGILSSLLAVSVERFEGLLDTLKTGVLAGDELNLLRGALDRLGLEDLEGTPEALRQAWAERKAALVARLEGALKQKLEAGFTYEYLRTREGTALLSLVCDDARAMALHRPLLEGNLSAALEGLRSEGVVLEQCLLRELTRETWALGFSLRLGRWAVGGTDQGELREVVQRNSLERDAPRRISFLGARRYSGQLFAPYASQTADFKADMAEFRAEPTVSDLDFGLYLLVRREPRTWSEQELSQALDEAVAWRVLDDADEREVLRRIREASGGGAVETRLELKFGDRATRGLFEHARDRDAHLVFARALARALPWYSVPCRERPTLREAVYAPLWRDYLEQNWSVADAARTVAARLKREPLAGYFATVEGRPGDGLLTFAEVIQKNPGTIGKWRDLRNGLLGLHNGIVQKRLPSLVRQSFQELQPMFGTSFHLRAAGAFFLELATRTEEGLASVEATFSVGTLDGQQLVFSKSRG